MAIMPPMKQISKKIAVKAKKLMPPRQQVRTTAAMVYKTATPEIPSTAFCHVGMPELRSARTLKK